MLIASLDMTGKVCKTPSLMPLLDGELKLGNIWCLRIRYRECELLCYAVYGEN